MIVRIGVVVLALAAPLATASAETLREQSEVTLDATAFRGLEVQNARGQIEVRAGSGDRIAIRALKVVRAPDRSRAEDIARQLRVEMSNTGDRKVVRVRYPQRQQVKVGLMDLFRGDVEFPRSEIRLSIEVPAKMPVWLHSTSGDVATEDLSGSQTVESTSGDVTVDAARGPVNARSTSGNLSGSFQSRARLRTVSGDVDVQHAGAALVATSTSGNIAVREAADSLVIETVSGDIEVGRAARGIRASSTSGNLQVRAVTGAADLQTSSGDIGVRLGPGLRSARLESGSGNLEARVAPGLGISLEVRTSNGNIESNLGMQVKSATRRQLSGSLGSGAIPVRLSSSSGDIQILSGGE